MSDKFVLYFNKMKQNPLLDRKQCVSNINGRSLVPRRVRLGSGIFRSLTFLCF